MKNNSSRIKKKNIREKVIECQDSFLFFLMCTNKKLEYLEPRVNIAKCVRAICQCVTATTMKTAE